jgi:hypothetical protein
MDPNTEKLVRGSMSDAMLRVGILVLAKSNGEVTYNVVRDVVTDLTSANPEMAIRMLTGLLILDMNRQDAAPKLHPISKN